MNARAQCRMLTNALRAGRLPRRPRDGWKNRLLRRVWESAKVRSASRFR